MWNWNPAKTFLDAFSQQKLLTLEKTKGEREDKKLAMEEEVHNALMPFRARKAQLDIESTMADIAGKNQQMEYKAGNLRASLQMQNGGLSQASDYGIKIPWAADAGDAGNFNGTSNFSQALAPRMSKQ